jgi:hypothetical protein
LKEDDDEAEAVTLPLQPRKVEEHVTGSEEVQELRNQRMVRNIA